MPLDEKAADRLLTFCGRLPALPADQRKGESDACFVLDCFAQRRLAVEAEINGGGPPGQDTASLRCEIDALDAARSVVTQLWQRRFGVALPGA
jgi:hypothetical protein